MQISKLIASVCVAACCASFSIVQAQDTPAQAAARAALMQQMSQFDQQPAQPAQAAQPTNPPPVLVTPSGVVPAQAAPLTIVRTVTVAGPTNTSPAVQVTATGGQPLSYQWNTATNTTLVLPSTNPPIIVTRPVVVPPAKPANPPGLNPILAPPLPITASKEMQLQSLLQQYLNDQITPEQYQIERAKILAEP
jgi:Tfp pilus assembly protein PilE